jgi:hypothetical protein
MFEADVLMSFYPLEFIRTSRNILDLYITAGMNFTHATIDKYSAGAIGPPINRISQVAGIGVEYVVRKQGKIMRAFLEFNCNQGFVNPTTAESSTNALPKMSTGLNFGIRVASRRQVKARPSTW